MKSKNPDMNLYYTNNGQTSKSSVDEANKRKKIKEREKRIKQNKQKEEAKDKFDIETETVINMTNKNKIQKDVQRKRKLTKQEQKRRKRNKKIKFILKVVLSLGIIIGGIIFSMTSPIFNIKNIEVINNTEVSSETIISISELKTDYNIFKFKKSDIIKNIKENPYIESVEVKRKLPSTVQIDVKERIPKYSVDFMGKYVYINTQGYLLEISEDSKGLPIIQGIVTPEEEIEPGKRLCKEDLERLEDVIKIIDIAKENELDTKITYVDISNKNEYIIYLNEENKKIHLGDNSNLNNKMIYVVALIEEEKEKAGDIFVNGDLNNKFQPYFREKIEI